MRTLVTNPVVVVIPPGASADEPFRPALTEPVPGEDSVLADLIEQDGRSRLDRGLFCDLDRYHSVVPDLVAKPISLDAAIDISLRSLAQRDGCDAPEERHAECLLRSYPHLAGPIRIAALLGNQLVSTAGIGGGRIHRQIAGLPRSIGTTLEDGRQRYELVRALGRGSSGTVFEAIDHLLSDSAHAAKVAVKLIPADPTTVQRQAAEATKARRIDHPGVVRVLDRGLTDQDELYLVYELVSGGDLHSWFEERKRSISVREAARLVAAIARGVQAAHSAGLVHCDLKPPNVLVTPEGEPRVSDFGVAAIAGSLGRSPSDSALPIGNLAFAAPEQARRSDAAASPLVDVYALGGILYYLVTASLPNGSTAQEVWSMHDPVSGRKQAPSIRTLRREAEARLDAIVSRALAPKPENRYPTAGEMALDLQAWSENRPIVWMQEPMASRARLWIRRSPGMAALAAACFLVLVGGGFATGFFAHRAQSVGEQAADLRGRMTTRLEGYETNYLRFFGKNAPDKDVPVDEIWKTAREINAKTKIPSSGTPHTPSTLPPSPGAKGN